ncbi:MAG: SPASM domain-containing protein [Armatimonadetes bacterium]|nr:SPASM domain-containing protein [Armatimonadota bacterium]
MRRIGYAEDRWESMCPARADGSALWEDLILVREREVQRASGLELSGDPLLSASTTAHRGTAFRPGRDMPCPFGSALAVAADGAVHACSLLLGTRLRCGTIGAGSLSGVVHGASLRSQCAEVLSRCRRAPACAACPYVALCGTGCAADAYLMHGSLTAPDPTCTERCAAYERFLLGDRT